MQTKLDYYRIFLEVVQQASFSKASETLFISQSAVSQTIKQLESDLDTTLFKRTTKGIILTKEGEVLYTYVQDALSSLQVAETRLSNMKALEEGVLIIGAGDTIASQYLLPYLDQFHKVYPNIKLQVINRTSGTMIDLIKKGKVDIAFINLPIKDSEVKMKPCFSVHDIFVCSKHKTLKNSYTRQEIANMPLILLEKKANSRQYVDQVFKKSHVPLQPQIEIGAHDLLLQFAKIDLGVACVIKEFSTTYLKRGDVVEIVMQDPLPKRAIGYAYHSKLPLSNAALSFLELLK